MQTNNRGSRPDYWEIRRASRAAQFRAALRRPATAKGRPSQPGRLELQALIAKAAAKGVRNETR